MRLIDADELLNKLPDDLPYKASVKRVLMQAETVEVVAKREVELPSDLPSKVKNEIDEKKMRALQELFEVYVPHTVIKKLCIGCVHHKVCEEVNSLKCRDKFIWYDAQSGCPYYCHYVTSKGFVDRVNDMDKLDELFTAGVITKDAYVRRLLQLATESEGDE